MWRIAVSYREHRSAYDRWDTMKDMQRALEQLRAQVAEYESIRDLATDQKKREVFSKFAQHFGVLAAQVEKAIADAATGDTFLGRKTNEHFPKEGPE